MNMMLVVLLLSAVVQGIAEFLPISSSGHLVLLKQIEWFRVIIEGNGEGLSMLIDVALHVATLIAVLIFMWKDVLRIIVGFIKGLFTRDFENPDFKTAIYILAASIPVGVIGFLLKDYLKILFVDPSIAAISAFSLLIFNGFILISTKRIEVKDRKLEEIGLLKSIGIGFFQAFAILPGISRAGSTIAGGMFLGLKPVEAAKFSMLMALPAIAGAGLLEATKLSEYNIPSEVYSQIGLAMIITIIVAMFSLKLLFALVKRIKLDIFGYYTIAFGSLGLLYILVIK